MLDAWILPALLGLGLAAATGLKTFLPLLMLSVAARFHLFGIELSDSFEWLGSLPALVALGVATLAELLADKIPVVDHGLSLVGTVARPIAGAIAAAAAFGHSDPTAAAVAGLIIGAPTAFAFNAAQGGTRAVSTATTGGLGNPIVSLAEDALAFVTALIALAAPILIPLVLALLAYAVWRLVRMVRRRAAPVSPAR